MYRGTLIDDLITAVQRAEAEAKPVNEVQRQPGMLDLQIFMRQMQHTQNIRQIRVGMA